MSAIASRRDISRYRDKLGLPHIFTFGDVVFFEDGDGNILAVMARAPAAIEAAAG